MYLENTNEKEVWMAIFISHKAESEVKEYFRQRICEKFQPH